jgi:hypothetical protein
LWEIQHWPARSLKKRESMSKKKGLCIKWLPFTKKKSSKTIKTKGQICFKHSFPDGWTGWFMWIVMKKISQSFINEIRKFPPQFMRVHRNLFLQEIMVKTKMLFPGLMRFLTSAIGKKYKNDIDFSFLFWHIQFKRYVND